MDREQIETRDQELIKRFRAIIDTKEIKPVPASRPLGPIFLVAALVISSMLLLTLVFSKGSKISSMAQWVKGPAEALTTGTVKIKASPETQKVLSPSQKIMDRQAGPNSPESDSTPVLEKENSPAKLSNQSVQGDMPSGIRIENIISCSSVNNKQYSRPKNKFSLAQDATPWIWMKVISENPPFTLTHVYYCNGRRYCEVPLAIRYRRMRTWSSVTLRSQDQIGKWRVDVVDDRGAKLDQIEFSVVK